MHRTDSLLLACAALAVTVSPASAQSSVSVNGLLDLGIFRGYDGINQVGTVQRSNLAFSGAEDLGGGNKAIFRLSTRFEMDTGANEGAGSKPFWHDEATVGLKGVWGTFRVGRAMTAMWANDWKFDPWCNYNRIASPAWQHWHALTPSDPFANNGTAEFGRLNNGIFYDSPTVHGVTMRFSGSFERRREPGAGGLPYSAVIEYGQGALAGMASFERNSVGDKDSFVAGKFSNGPYAVMAAFNDSRTFDDSHRSLVKTISATYRKEQVTFKVGLSRQRLDGVNHRFVSFGADYALGKRTTVYFSAGHQDAKTSLGGGVSHSF